MQIIFRLISIVFFLSISPFLHSQDNSKQFYGVVVKIVDGDTYDILSANKSVFRIRMNGIDAPEKGQAHSQTAKEYLGKLCMDQTIRIKWYSKDRNGRYIADGYLKDGRSLSIEMIKAGYAWHFKKYSKDTVLDKAEIKAREEKLGLWMDINPEAPWDRRKKRG